MNERGGHAAGFEARPGTRARAYLAHIAVEASVTGAIIARDQRRSVDLPQLTLTVRLAGDWFEYAGDEGWGRVYG